MSVRAYRVNEIITEDNNTFNLWHAHKLMDILEGNGFYETLTEGSGLSEIPVSVLEEALEADLKDIDATPEDEKEIKKALKQDIAWAKKHQEDYIKYYCY